MHNNMWLRRRNRLLALTLRWDLQSCTQGAFEVIYSECVVKITYLLTYLWFSLR